MRSDSAAAPARGSSRRLTHSVLVLSLVVLTGAFSAMGATLSPATAHAATPNIAQCNDIGPSAEGATTAMTCTVTVTNTISKGGATHSTTTLTRDCKLGPCPPGNGTFTTSSSSLVTNVAQCNGSDNDSAHPIVCDVTIVNNISADTPGALPLTAATVNQCVGSGQGGGGVGTTGCDPYPATTTSATITQCNGSGNGGGGGVACTVASASRVSPAIPVRVNQCNGTGNPGGTIVRCRTRITTNITAVSAGTTATPAAGVAGSQVTRLPTGGVQTGGGSTAGLRDTGLLALGGALLLAALLGAKGTARRRR